MTDNKLIILDLEATCWRGHPPSGEMNEIIEIGVCLLDLSTGDLSDKRSYLIKPTLSKISTFCTELTSITPEMVEIGMTYAEVCQALVDNYDSQNRTWGSWGNYDHKMIKAQCELFGVPYPFGASYINFKERFAKLANRHKKTGMAGALKILDMPLEGTHHRGDDDAWNIGRIVSHLLKTYGHDALLK